MDVKEIIKELIQFRVDRGWGKHHTSQELSRSLMIEAAELNRIFQWGQEPETPAGVEHLGEEIADNFIYLLYLCEKYHINPELVIHDKIEKNAIKYPIKQGG